MSTRKSIFCFFLLTTPSFAQIVSNPNTSQSVVQPRGTTFNPNSVLNIRLATTDMYWQQDNIQTPLTANKVSIITLTPCPKGIAGTDNQGEIRIFGDTNPEAIQMNGAGNCISGAATGTISFIPHFDHA